MDSIVLSSLDTGPLRLHEDKNDYSNDVPPPNFLPLYQAPSTASGGSSFMSIEVQDDLEVSYFSIEDTGASGRIIGEKIDAIDPLRGTLKTSKYKYTRDYYDIKILDSLLNFVRAGDSVMLCYPRARQYFVEMNCLITMLFLNTRIKKVGSQLIEAGESTTSYPDDTFYLAAVEKKFVDDLFYVFFDDVKLEERWNPLKEKFVEHPHQLILFEEEYYGRNAKYSDKDSAYDITFIEPIFKSIVTLSEGGNVVMKLRLLGSRLAADIIYVYKYLFETVTILKPSTSNLVSMEHYLVARNFNRSRYVNLSPAIDNLLTKLQPGYFTMRKEKKDLIVFSLVSNFSEAGGSGVIRPTPISLFSTPSPSAIPTTSISAPTAINGLKEWIIRSNDRIGFSVFSQSMTLFRAIDDEGEGFKESNPLFLVDQSRYREGLGELGRTTLQSIPEFNTNFDLDPQILDQTMTDKEGKDIGGKETKEIGITETGQISKKQLNLKVLSSTLGWGFNLYSKLNLHVVEKILRLPDIAPLFPVLGSTIGRDKITNIQIEERKKELTTNLKRWLGLLFSLGDISMILGNQGVALDEQSIIRILREREWSIQDIFGANLSSMIVYQIAIDPLLIKLGEIFGNFAKVSQVLPQDQIVFRITPLSNFRFRLTYVMEGVKYGLSYGNNISVVGEYEFLNLLLPEEQAQLASFYDIQSHFTGRNFLTRVFSHCALPVYFAGKTNELAVPDLYFSFKPDLEFFASAINRHAPYWCSGNPDDERLGSQGNFFGKILDPNHELYTSGKVKLALAFPPNDPRLITTVITECIRLFATIYRRRDEYVENSKNNPNLSEIHHFAIIMVYAFTDTNAMVLNGVLNSLNLNQEFFDYKLVERLYDPFSGLYLTDEPHKAIMMKTRDNPIHFTSKKK